VLIKPGPTDTPMTAHLKARGARLAPVEAVAAGIARAIERGQPVAYLPAPWRFIMAVIKRLPRFVFHRLAVQCLNAPSPSGGGLGWGPAQAPHSWPRESWLPSQPSPKGGRGVQASIENVLLLRPHEV
jgi:hypothetical protein